MSETDYVQQKLGVVDITTTPSSPDVPLQPDSDDQAMEDARPQANSDTVPGCEQEVSPATVNSSDAIANPQSPQPAGVWETPIRSEHPEGEKIRRQVEYYFSDENLPSDAHMLMKTGGAENLPVSVKHILGFSRMRRYKPPTAVIESLKKSTFLDVVDGKYLRRKVPLNLTLLVEPQSQATAKKEKKMQQEKKLSHVVQQAQDKPWLTKGMLKATGFEEFYTDPPVTPVAFAAERELYDSEISFKSRIETALFRYTSKRKFHQKTKFIFDAFMKYGGIDCTQKQFSGGALSAQELDDLNAADIAAVYATHRISGKVDLNEEKWEVDFEGVASGFLSSSKIMNHLLYATQTEIMATTNVLRNFYNYILHHDVCPEYTNKINAARKICSLADQQLFDTIFVGRQLPGDFNSAVSRLHGGCLAGVFGDGQSWDGADNLGGSETDSRDIIMAAIAAHGTDEQYSKASASRNFEVVYEEDVIFEVNGFELADPDTSELYEQARGARPFLKTVGKLFCRRWTYPLARRSRDLYLDETHEMQRPGDTFMLYIEDDLLEHFFVGMKIEGKVKGLDIGILWLDRVDTVNPSFFQLLPNEFWDKQKAVKAEESRFYGDDEDGKVNLIS